MRKESSNKMGKRSTIILSVVISILAPSLCFGIVIEHSTGRWPDSWPKELEPYRKQARTREIAAGNQENVYEIRFENREEFEKLWPIILKLKDKKAPLRLRSTKKPIKKGSLFSSEKPVVRVFSHVYPAWPSQRPGGRKLRPAPPWPDSIKSPTGELPEYVAISEDGNGWIPVEKEKAEGFMWIPERVRKPRPRGFMYRARTEIELVVDGTIIDLNRILLPPDTPIIDKRFEDKVAGHNKPLEPDAN
ncbi:MAG: hypothetical protein ACYSWO_04325 [Planctomycetota bacterium]|jgi:hypothetical protein